MRQPAAMALLWRLNLPKMLQCGYGACEELTTTRILTIVCVAYRATEARNSCYTNPVLYWRLEMKLRFLGLLAAAPLALMAPVQASATTYNLGNVDDFAFLPELKISASTSPFIEIYKVHLDYTEQLVISSEEGSTSENASDSAGAPVGYVELFSGMPTGKLLDSSPITAGSASGAYDASLSDIVGSGNYYVELTGTFAPKLKAGGLDKKAYFLETGSLTVTAVPEISTWAMMLLGFAGLGFAGYRSNLKTYTQIG